MKWVRDSGQPRRRIRSTYKSDIGFTLKSIVNIIVKVTPQSYNVVFSLIFLQRDNSPPST